MDEPINIFITDDHQVVREGIRALLEENPAFFVCGEAQNGKEAVTRIEKMPHKPAVILMDINMPVMDGIECTREIFSLYKGTIKILALTMVAQGAHIRRMLQAGASGYLLKDCDKEELYKAIVKVVAGETYYSLQAGQIVMNELTPHGNSHEPTDQSYLTRREIEVLSLIARDLSNQEIADKLFISIRTVESHKQNLIVKTGAKSVVGLIIYGIRHGLIDGNA